MRIGIAGAGAVGRSVAQELLDYGHKVLLIERDRSHYEPHIVPDAEWLLADACELAALEESGLETCAVGIFLEAAVAKGNLKQIDQAGRQPRNWSLISVRYCRLRSDGSIREGRR